MMRAEEPDGDSVDDLDRLFLRDTTPADVTAEQPVDEAVDVIEIHEVATSVLTVDDTEPVDEPIIDLRDGVRGAHFAKNARAESSDGPLFGKVVVVTGADSGAGRAIALAVVNAGARVCAIGGDVSRLRETVSFAGRERPILYLQCDVGSVSEIESVVDFIDRFDRPIDVLVHAAGVHVGGGILHGAVADLDEQYLVNVRGPYLLSQQLMSRVQEAQGHVVFVNENLRPTISASLGQHSIAAAALSALVDALREEVRGSGVRVTAVTVEVDEDSAALTDEVANVVLRALDGSNRVELSDINVRNATPSVV